MIVTHIERSYRCDTFFPEIDPAAWTATAREPQHRSAHGPATSPSSPTNAFDKLSRTPHVRTRLPRPRTARPRGRTRRPARQRRFLQPHRGDDRRSWPRVGALFGYLGGATQNDAALFKNNAAIDKTAAADQLELLPGQVEQAEPGRTGHDAAGRRPAKYKAEVARYEAEKADIKKEAEKLGSQVRRVERASRTHAMHTHHQWALATTAEQIAISLAAITLLTRRRWLLRVDLRGGRDRLRAGRVRLAACGSDRRAAGGRRWPLKRRTELHAKPPIAPAGQGALPSFVPSLATLACKKRADVRNFCENPLLIFRCRARPSAMSGQMGVHGASLWSCP